MKHLKFPSNNANLVVIPSNEKGTGFLRTCYDQDILEHMISKEDFQDIVDQASKVVAKVYSKKRLADTAEIDGYKTLLSIIAFLLGMAFMVMIYVAIDQQIIWMMQSAYGAMSGAFLIIGSLALYECFRDGSKKFIKFNNAVKVNLDRYFEKTNQRLADKGLVWSVQEGHYWIECRINIDIDRMRTTPNQNFFTQDRITTNQETDFNDLKNIGNKRASDETKKPYSRGSEPEMEDQLTPKKNPRTSTAQF